MAKWKCEICGKEFENFHAQGFDNQIYCPLCYFKRKSKDLQQRINKAIEIIDYRLKENDKHINVHMEMFHYRNLKEILKSDIQETNPYPQYWFNQCMVLRKILITLEKWLDEERKVTYRDAGHAQRAYQNCYDKLQDLKKDSDNNE